MVCGADLLLSMEVPDLWEAPVELMEVGRAQL